MSQEKTKKEKKIREKKTKLTPVFSMMESALTIWWKNLKKIIGVYVWGIAYTLPFLLIMVVGGSMMNYASRASSTAYTIAGLLLFLAGLFLAFYFALRAYLGIFLLVKNDYRGKELTIYRETKDIFFPYLLLAILSTVLIMLWTLLLIIPGLIFSVFYCLSVYVFFFEDKRGMAAIRRSRDLVRGYWWPVAGRVLFVGVCVWLFAMLISWPIALVPEKSAFAMFWQAVVQVINFLIGPIVLLFNYHIFQDLVKIKK